MLTLLQPCCPVVVQPLHPCGSVLVSCELRPTAHSKISRKIQWLPTKMNDFQGISGVPNLETHLPPRINAILNFLNLKPLICMGNMIKNYTSETHLPRHSFDTFAVH